MAFGICRIRTLHFADLQSTDIHNARRYDSEESYPQNIDPKREHSTIYYKGVDDYYSPEQTDLDSIVRHRIESNNVKGIKSNGRVAIEYVLGISDVGAWENYSAEGYFQNCKQWLEKRHGEGSVVAYSRHEDESNPHAHFIVVPLITKDVKWKNSKGSGTRTETRSNVREFINGRDTLRQLQTDYHEFAKRFEKKMGIELYRGTYAEFQTKEYSRSTDHEIGKIRAELDVLRTKKEKLIEYLQKQVELAKSLFTRKEIDIEIKNQEQQKKEDKYTKENWWKKGTQSDKFFHDDKDKKKDPGRGR
jgi:hypothetical protein